MVYTNHKYNLGLRSNAATTELESLVRNHKTAENTTTRPVLILGRGHHVLCAEDQTVWETRNK